MRVLFIRHAPAGDRAEYAKTGKSDGGRPLTSAGRKKMRKAARGLTRLMPSLDIVATSPLRRAWQTSRIVAEAFDGARLIELAELSPTSHPKELAARLRTLADAKVIALVGHEPHLSSAVDYMTTGGRGLRLELKKGACCLVEFEHKPEMGAGTILWSLAPAHLRKLS